VLERFGVELGRKVDDRARRRSARKPVDNEAIPKNERRGSMQHEETGAPTNRVGNRNVRLLRRDNRYAQQGRRSGVRKQCVVPAPKHCSHRPLPSAPEGTRDAIDAGMDTFQRARRDTMVDLPFGEAALDRLCASHNAVLALGEREQGVHGHPPYKMCGGNDREEVSVVSRGRGRWRAFPPRPC